MPETKITRREMLKLTGLGTLGVAIGASGMGGVIKLLNDEDNTEVKAASAQQIEPFYGGHQAGIQTPTQQHVYFAALTALVSSKAELQALFEKWTPLAERLMKGEPLEDIETANQYVPPVDTGDTLSSNTSHLTLTFGVGPTLFTNEKLGLTAKKPKALTDLPHFPKDQLDDAISGGDICIQACADDPQVAFHAVRNLIRAASGQVQIKWSETGFNSIPTDGGTPRNLFSFKDGTVNPSTNSDFNEQVWVDDRSWLRGGTYLIFRKIQMHLETWDRTALFEQENTFGRARVSGAPLGKEHEFDEVDLTLKDENGKPYIPETSHVFLAKQVKAKIKRRAFSYSSGIVTKTGAYDAGLLFISFQKNPQAFIDIQNSLGRNDKLNEYITHRSSAIFACFSGINKGSFIGEALFKN
ncbi:iron uptake transporter deferrochelatase/peroxidase subunit [Solibacillus sp. FSL H8-0538]|uniref:iron uptake transporter deferrochelatase/peroxidase subunit n=1 Tax=Solibacillus sp. FSL H8-0538 TaxID=2921400 RepID=UPI0030F798EF